jgi:hypothetical protein
LPHKSCHCLVPHVPFSSLNDDNSLPCLVNTILFKDMLLNISPFNFGRFTSERSLSSGQLRLLCRCASAMRCVMRCNSELPSKR